MVSRRRCAPRTAFRARSRGRPRHPDDRHPPAQALDDPHPGDVGVSGSRHRARAGDATIAAGSTTRGGRTRGKTRTPCLRLDTRCVDALVRKGKRVVPPPVLMQIFRPRVPPMVSAHIRKFRLVRLVPIRNDTALRSLHRTERIDVSNHQVRAARPSLMTPHSSPRARRSPAWTRDGRPREDRHARDRLRLLLTPVPSSPTPAP